MLNFFCISGFFSRISIHSNTCGKHGILFWIIINPLILNIGTFLNLGLLIGLRKLVILQPHSRKTSSQRASIKPHVFIKISKTQDTDLHGNLPGTFHYTYFQHNMYPLLLYMGTRFAKNAFFPTRFLFQPNSSTQPDSDSWFQPARACVSNRRNFECKDTGRRNTRPTPSKISNIPGVFGKTLSCGKLPQKNHENPRQWEKKTARFWGRWRTWRKNFQR